MVCMKMVEILEAYEELNLPGRTKQIAEVKAQLYSEGIITVGFLGAFSSGKSSLIDALVGRRLLPTAALPKTSKPTKIINSPDQSLVIHYTGGVHTKVNLPAMNANPEDLTKILLENVSDVNAVAQYVINVPMRPSSPRYCLLDTPGINSLDSKHAALTKGLLQSCDIFVYVLNGAQPLSADDAALLKQISGTKPVFLILNKADLFDATEQSVEDIMSSVKENLEKRQTLSNYFLYAVSARQALQSDGADLTSFNQMDQFLEKLFGIIDQNHSSVTNSKSEEIIGRLWPSIREDYEADLQFHRETRSQKKRNRAIFLGLVATLVLVVGGYFTSQKVILSRNISRLKSLNDEGKAAAITYLKDYPEILYRELGESLGSADPRAHELLSMLTVIKELPDIAARTFAKELRQLAKFPDRDIAELCLEIIGSTGLMTEDFNVLAGALVQGDPRTRIVAAQGLRKFYKKKTASNESIVASFQSISTQNPTGELLSELLSFLHEIHSQQQVVQSFEKTLLSAMRKGDDLQKSLAIEIVEKANLVTPATLTALEEVIRQKKDSAKFAARALRSLSPERWQRIEPRNSIIPAGVEESVSMAAASADMVGTRIVKTHSWVAVNVSDCLNMRQGPGLKFQRLNCVPPKHAVYVKEATRVADTHEDIRSYWYKVKYYRKDSRKSEEGYMFGGYLTPYTQQ